VRCVVADAEELGEGAAVVRQVGGRSVGVFRVDGRLHALRNSCPHMGGPVCRGRLGGTMLPSQPGSLVWGLAGRVLRCPWHGWEFDVTTGRALFGISDRRIPTYPVAEVDGQIVVELPGRAAGNKG
jgi:nitrite reductase (NADH) small subunit